jgi:hypothetical protein
MVNVAMIVIEVSIMETVQASIVSFSFEQHSGLYCYCNCQADIPRERCARRKRGMRIECSRIQGDIEYVD